MYFIKIMSMLLNFKTNIYNFKDFKLFDSISSEKFSIALIIILIFKKDLMRNLFPENIFQAALENVQTVQRNRLNTSDSM